MSKDVLNEREFELINIVGAQLAQNQRDLSQQMDLSLGSVNMLIKRLISKGYIRIRQLNERKMKYILTPKGFAEKMRKSVNYTMKTINSIGVIKKSIKQVIDHYHDLGERNFFVLGKSDLASLVKFVMDETHNECTGYFIDKAKKQGKGVLLICEENVDIGSYQYSYVVDVIQELAKSEELNRIGDISAS